MAVIAPPILDMSTIFKALGDPTRLQIFELLCKCEYPLTLADNGDVRVVCGPTVGEVCCSVTGAEKINSKISFHLKELRLAGLILVERQGKNMVCNVNRQAVEMLQTYFGSRLQPPIEPCC
ncbi:MAG: metalloregulator ArsR/SmtB family transcription factor [Chthonomonadales bacterium]